MKIRIVLAAASLVLPASVAFAPAAHAATTGGTIATFSITAGSLDIVVPGSTVPLATGTIATGALTASALLGAVSVTDNRGLLVGNWTTSVSSTAFVTGSSTPDETVTPARIAYLAGTATATSGDGVFTPAASTPLAATPATAASYVGVGNNTATWNPTLTFTLLSSQVAGLYTGTVTHSVA